MSGARSVASRRVAARMLEMFVPAVAQCQEAVHHPGMGWSRYGTGARARHVRLCGFPDRVLGGRPGLVLVHAVLATLHGRVYRARYVADGLDGNGQGARLHLLHATRQRRPRASTHVHARGPRKRCGTACPCERQGLRVRKKGGYEHGGLHVRVVRKERGHATKYATRPAERVVHDGPRKRRAQRVAVTSAALRSGRCRYGSTSSTLA
jgi:hypothetical protein